MQRYLTVAFSFAGMRFFGVGGGLRPATPDGRIKVTDQLVWINVVPMDGVPRRVGAFPGESLLEAINRHKIHGIYSDDNGGDREGSMEPHQIPYDYYSMGVSSGQCAVIIADQWIDKVNKMHSQEEKILTRRNEGNTRNTRLASCIQVRPELNEMIIAVGNNSTEAAGETLIY